MDTTVALRLAELKRRVEALPVELGAWKKRTEAELGLDAQRAGATSTPDANLYNANFSQVQTIDGLLGVGIASQKELVEKLARASSAKDFAALAWTLTQEVIESHHVWDYFREKLNLRLVLKQA